MGRGSCRGWGGAVIVYLSLSLSYYGANPGYLGGQQSSSSVPGWLGAGKTLGSGSCVGTSNVTHGHL